MTRMMKAAGVRMNPARVASAPLIAWADLTDLSTLFQTETTATPVTAAGQPIGRVNSKGGTVAALTQTVAGSRPLYLAGGGGTFDGTDDHLWSAVAHDAATNGLTIIARIKSDPALNSDRRFASLGSSTTSNFVGLQSIGAPNLSAFVRPNIVANLYVGSNLVVSDNTDRVAAVRFSNSMQNVTFFVDDLRQDVTIGVSSAFTYDRFALGANLRSSAQSFFVGPIYEAAIYGGAVSDAEIAPLLADHFRRPLV